MSGSAMYQDNANRRIPVSHKYPHLVIGPGSLTMGSKQEFPGPVRHGVNAVRLQALLSTIFVLFMCFDISTLSRRDPQISLRMQLMLSDKSRNFPCRRRDMTLELDKTGIVGDIWIKIESTSYS
jgi:hypothetical protein